MKHLLLIIAVFFSFTLNAQVIELGLNFGSANEASVGLSTYKWLYVGASYQSSRTLYFFNGNNNHYTFYTPTAFIEPVIKIGDIGSMYGVLHYGLYYDSYGNAGSGTLHSLIGDFGVNVKIIGKLYANASCEYLQLQGISTEHWLGKRDIPSSQWYWSAGFKFYANSGRRKNITNSHQ